VKDREEGASMVDGDAGFFRVNEVTHGWSSRRDEVEIPSICSASWHHGYVTLYTKNNTK
jgi:hypothetical protein